MKISRNILSALIAAGAPGVALLALSNRIPADVALGALTAIAIVAFAIFDYSRNTASLKMRAPVLRPTLPALAAQAPRLTRKAA